MRIFERAELAGSAAAAAAAGCRTDARWAIYKTDEVNHRRHNDRTRRAFVVGITILYIRQDSTENLLHNVCRHILYGDGVDDLWSCFLFSRIYF